MARAAAIAADRAMGEAGAGEAQQVVDQANESGGKQGGYGGHGQVVGGVGGYAGEGGEHGGDEVAAVVVGDGVSGQPLVLGGKAVGVDDGVHNAEVHWFFGVVDGGGFADEQGPEGEYGQKGQLDGDDKRPAAAQKVGQFGALSPGQDGGADAQQDQGGADAQLGVGDNAQDAAHPGGPGQREQGKDGGDGATAVGQAAHYQVRGREAQQRQGGQGGKPGDDVQHGDVAASGDVVIFAVAPGKAGSRGAPGAVQLPRAPHSDSGFWPAPEWRKQTRGGLEAQIDCRPGPGALVRRRGRGGRPRSRRRQRG